MSLTSNLKDPRSPIRQFMDERLSNTKTLAIAANAQLRATTTLLPSTFGSAYPWAVIGMAVDYRLRYFFAATPSREFVAYQGVRGLANHRLNAALYNRGIDINISAEVFYEDVEKLEAFFDGLDQFVATICPIGRLIPEAEDMGLARYCVALSLFEVYYRSGSVHDLLYTPTVCKNAEELLARVDDVWAHDVCQIGQRFYERCASLFALPHVLNPTFTGSIDVGGADADLIVNGELIDIKTTKNLKFERDWLTQIVGYLLLDYDDTLAIQSVGIYMSRQGELIMWPVDELLSTLTKDSTVTLPALRAEFRAVCQSLHKHH